MNFDALNLLTPDMQAIPKYTPDPANRCIKAHYPGDGKVILVGVADNNFIFWLSVNGLDETQKNSRIFEHIQNMTPAVYGSEAIVLERKTPYAFEQFRHFYCAVIESADDILRQYASAKQQSKARGSDSDLIEQMQKQYRELLCRTDDPIADYSRHEALIREIKSHNDLRCAESNAVREMYIKLERLCSDIYNSYMTAAH